MMDIFEMLLNNKSTHVEICMSSKMEVCI